MLILITNTKLTSDMAIDVSEGFKRVDKAAEVFPIYKKLKNFPTEKFYFY